MTISELQEILGKRITYKRGWGFYLGNIDCPQALYLQIQFRTGSCESLRIVHGRRWLLADQMTESEVVQTALKAVLDIEEQLARETFQYQGKAFFNPEVLNLETMLRICFARPQVPTTPINKADTP